MPTFEITSPDGKVFQVDAPEGATKQDALAHIQSQYQPQEQVSTGEDVAKAAGSGLAQGAMSSPFWLNDLSNMITQGLTRTFGAGKEGLANLGIGEHLTLEQAKSLTDPATPPGSGDILSPVVDFYEPKTTAGNVANVVANIVGNVGGAKAIQKTVGGLINPSRIVAPELQNETLIGKNPDLKTYGGEEIGKKLNTAEQAAYNAKKAAYETADPYMDKLKVNAAKPKVPSYLTAEMGAPEATQPTSELGNMLRSSTADFDPNVVNNHGAISSIAKDFDSIASGQNVTYADINKIGKRLNALPKATDADAAIRARALSEFHDYNNNLLTSGLIEGDPKAIALIKDANAKNAYWRKNFTGSDANKLISNYIEKAGGANALPPEALFDKFINIGDAGYSNIKALKNVVGEDIVPSLKAGFYNRLHSQSLMADGETINPQKMAKAIDTFLSKNQTLANEVFTPEEINALRRTSSVAAKYAKTGIAPKGIVAKISTKLPAVGPLIEKALESKGYNRMVKDLSAPPTVNKYPSVLPMLNPTPLKLTITPQDKQPYPQVNLP